MIYASVKGFGPGPYEDCKVYENVAQCTGGAASTTGFDDGPPLVTGAQIGDCGTGLHLAPASSRRCSSATRPARASACCAMQDGVLNLCRVKLRDQQRLAHGPLKEYPQYPNGEFGDAVPRAGNASGGGQPGCDPQVQGLGDRSQRLHLCHHPGAGLGADLRGHRQAGLDHRSGIRDAEGASAAAQSRCSRRSSSGR